VEFQGFMTAVSSGYFVAYLESDKYSAPGPAATTGHPLSRDFNKKGSRIREP